MAHHSAYHFMTMFPVCVCIELHLPFCHSLTQPNDVLPESLTESPSHKVHLTTYTLFSVECEYLGQ